MIVGGKTVIDERCRCGHLKSEHSDEILSRCMQCPANDGKRGEVGHCSQFTWKEFIFVK